MSTTNTEQKIYTRWYADKFGRLTSCDQRSVPFPVHSDLACDPAQHYLNEHGERCDKSELELDTTPPIIDGVIAVEVGAVAAFHSVPAGSFVSEGPTPLSVLDAIEDVGIGLDMPGEVVVVIESPRHFPVRVTVRVVPPAVVEKRAP